MELQVKKLHFSSYIKLALLMSVSFGTGLGVIIFIVSLLGGNATATVGSNQLTGISAGSVGLLIAPLTMLIMGALFALMSYLPFILVMRLTRGFTLKGDITPNDVLDPRSEPMNEVQDNDQFDQYESNVEEYTLPETKSDTYTNEDEPAPVQEIMDLQQFREIKSAGRGYIVITDSANPTRVHKPSCSWVKEENFITKVIDTARTQGRYYWVESKIQAEEMRATRCGKCM